MRVATAVLVAARQPHEMLDVTVAEPRAGEVRVRIAASGVCHSCLYAIDGEHAAIPTPIVLGDEGAGVVESVGPGVTGVTASDHVVVSWAPGCATCRTCRQGLPALCTRQPPLGRMADGTTRFRYAGGEVFHYGPATNAPFTVVTERAVVPIDPAVPLDLAALIGCAATTGVGAVRTTARVRTGEGVAVVGCGGVGMAALHAAALAGAYPVIALDVQPLKFAALLRMGATHCVNAADPDAAEQVRAIAGRGVDHSFVTTSAASAFPLAMAVLAARGTCVLIAGYPDGATVTFDPGHLLNGERRIVASKYGSANPPVDFPDLAALYLAGRLDLAAMVSHRWRPEQMDEAYDALRSGTATRGLIVFDTPAVF